MKSTELFKESHRATYCPEDNKLRLYVGRVPRDEYDALRAEGWQATPKQSCDFAAPWTVDRKETAESYAGIIEDEDQSPEDRAADRAERFGGYRDARLSEATGHADRYEAGPAVHGYQSQARGERAAARHDRTGARAVDAWDRADYWTRRTAGVISHALHVSSPSVRMGRIKTLEADLRRAEEAERVFNARRNAIAAIAADPAGAVADTAARHYGGDLEKAARSIMETIAGHGQHRNPHPDAPGDAAAGYVFQHLRGEHPPTVAHYAQAWIARHPAPEDPETDQSPAALYRRHLRNRLAYEWQMLEAQGGRESLTEMEKGGTLGGRVIAKVNKSPKTGRVVSVAVVGPSVGERWVYGAANEPGTPFALYTVETERLAPGAYSPPTDESRAKLAEFEAAKKAAAAARKETVPACPLVNPSEEDAERLQAVWNEAGAARRKAWGEDPAPKVARMTQAQYSAVSRGEYAAGGTVEITGGGFRQESPGHMGKPLFPGLAKVRAYGHRVVILTDKPGKPLPAAVWVDPRPAEIEWCKENAELIRAAARHTWLDGQTAEEREAFNRARRVGLAYASSQSQFGLSDAGREILGLVKA